MEKNFKDCTVAELYKICKKHGRQYIKCEGCALYYFCYTKSKKLREFVAPVDWDDCTLWRKKIKVGEIK